MSKTVTAKQTDPFAAARSALLEGVNAMTENHEKVVQLAQAELAKAKENAAAQAEKAQAAIQANADAALAAGRIVAGGAEKVGALVQDEVKGLVDGRVAALKQVIGAATIKDVIDIQVALAKAEQTKAKAFVEAVTKLGQAVANDAIKPVEAQVGENLKALKAQAA